MKKVNLIKIYNRQKYGGVAYGNKVKNLFKNNFDFQEIKIEANKNTPRYFKIFDWFFKISKIKGYSNIWMEDSFIAAALTNFNKIKGKIVILIYHIDNSVFLFIFRPIFFLLERIFYNNAKKADAIVVISEYWKSRFLAKGYKNVQRIYPGFNLNDFVFGEDEIRQLKEKYKLSDKPIIYIGNCQKAKGVVESYEALKNLDVHLVTSGNQDVKIPAKNLNLEYIDYLRLLKSCTIVVTMSKFKEGWCMTAHEAMLCKTPVIGSGLGGMKELLEGGKQIICPNFKDLKEKVGYLLNNQEVRLKMGENGFNYAHNFTMEKFKKEWMELVDKIA